MDKRDNLAFSAGYVKKDEIQGVYHSKSDYYDCIFVDENLKINKVWVSIEKKY